MIENELLVCVCVTDLNCYPVELFSKRFLESSFHTSGNIFAEIEIETLPGNTIIGDFSK